MAFWVGLGLTASGASLQGLFQNPLADPYILGVSGGASLAGCIALALGFEQTWSLFGASFLGALAVCLILIQVTGRESIILAGLLINAFASSLISLIKTLLPAEGTQSLLFWLLGSFSLPEPKMLIFLGVICLASVLFLNAKSGTIERLGLGDDEAARLGLNPSSEKRQLYLVISLLVGAITAFCGFIGFIGLLVPQILRRFTGNNQVLLIPASALCGGLMLALFDLLSQYSHQLIGFEIPVGVITALIGTPVFGAMAYAAHRKSMRLYAR
ncbi:MAG: iron ABC transporter permease [Deltaproteobacteria bacterium]|nr:iron ABC transporter permease [Deltaproteobacteria bacterium]